MEKIEKLAFASSQNLKERDYWLNKLAGDLSKSSFPYDNNLQYLNNEATRKEVVQFRMPGELSARLNKICGNQDVKLHVILVAGVAVLLEKYCGNEDIIVGTPIYKQEIEADFINTVLALRNRLRSNMTFKELILQVHGSIFEAIENQNYPIETLLYLLDMPQTGNGFPLFDTAILLKNLHDERYIQNIPLDVIFTFLRAGDSIEGAVEFNAMLYQGSTIKRIIRHLQRFFQEALFNVDLQLSHIDILTEEERKQQLFDFNETDAGYPKDKTIHQLFAQQEEKTPDSIALGGVQGHLPTEYVLITYKKLNESVDCLAGELTRQCVNPDDIIGIMSGRSLEMVTAILAVLKAGGAYMPIDPDYPEDRANFMLKDSNVKVLLTDNPSRHFNCQLSMVNCRLSMKEKTQPETLLSKSQPAARSPQLAYVIYTSGSTGQPKGVLIEHKNVVRLMVNDKFLFDFNNHDVWTLFHSYCFDFSVWEMYGALLYGGKLVIIPRMTARDPVRYLEILKDEKVTVLNQTPSAFYGLSAEELKFPDQKLCLRYVIFGGEALMPQKLKKWKEKYPETRLINMYGITETTVHVTFKEINDTDIQANIGNIGKPIPTLTVYIVDKNLKLLPIGVSGEICVGGEGVGRGYLNRQELTQERIKRDPYRVAQGGKVYRSGDLGRLLESSDIEYLGRIDQQVKIRGFRIELGEIENQLQKYNGIKETVVTVREDKSGNKHLCAYIVPEPDEEISIPSLKECLATRFPDYMIPLYFIQLEEIPLTSNGKVDRKKLPAPSGNLIDIDTYTPPKSEMEKKLVEIWKSVLELEQLGVKDNFFNVGGDSIKAIKIVNSINKQLQTNLRIPDLYLNETIEKLTVIIEQNKFSHHENRLKEVLSEIEEQKNRIMGEVGERPGELAGIDIEDIEDLYPMSDIEKGMVYHSVKEPGQAIYHDQMVHQITYVEFDPERFKKAMRLMMEKHPILRTSLHIGDFEEEIQIVHKFKESNMEIEHYDISNMEMQDQEVYIKKFIWEDTRRPFNAAKLPLWRLKTFALDKNNLVVLWTFHHAIIDGWSDASFKTELNNIYLRLKTEPEFIPLKLKSSLKEFILEQEAVKKNKDIREYWRNELEDYKRLTLPGILEKKEEPPGTMGYSINLGISLLNQLNQIADRYNTTLKHLCFGAYIYMLNILSYESDITVGLVTNNRPICQDGDKILGCFLNTIPIRIKIPTPMKWSDYIRMMDKKLKGLSKYDRLSLFEIVKITGEFTIDQNPLFDTLFNFVDFYVYQEINLQQILKNTRDNVRDNELSVGGQVVTNTLFDFTINTTLGEFAIQLSYSTALFDKEMILKLIHYFRQALNKFIHEPEEVANKNQLMELEEKQKLLYEFNRTGTPYPHDKTLHQLFEAQAARNPDNIAVIGHSAQRTTDREESLAAYADLHAITYKESNEKSNQLACLLKQKGVQPDTIVGIMLGRSIEMIIGILGILKTGGGYLPIELESPGERIKYMLADSSAKVLVTTSSLAEEGKKERRFEGKKILLEEFFETPSSSSTFPSTHLDLPSAPATALSFSTSTYQVGSANLAYVIYTSGSTGKPKGVMVEHQNVVGYVNAFLREFKLTANDTMMQQASSAFDAFIEEVFPILTRGGKLAIPKKDEIIDMKLLSGFILKNKISVISCTPLLLNELNRIGSLKSVTTFISGGDELKAEHVDNIVKRATVYNTYGPTETTVCATYYRHSISTSTGAPGTTGIPGVNIPIGRPIANYKVYILDSNDQLLPVGVPGEICVSGVGVARGYLNRPELTAEKFVELEVKVEVEEEELAWEQIPNKHMSYPSHMSYIYKTGDLGKWLFDGNIRYLGRIDHQVKIRGYRIELGEIENQLKKHTQIREAVVVVNEDETGDKLLCAYYVSKTGVSLSELREGLARVLPDYMIPSYFMHLERMPLTPNGKLDRRALPPPVVKSDTAYAAPRNKTEENLTQLWGEILGIEKNKIGIDDSFFELGGHSLRATVLATKIHKKFNIKVPLKVIFNTPTIRGVAQYIYGAAEDRFSSLDAVEKKEYYPLSSAQKRLYILQQMKLDSTAYNMPEFIPLEKGSDLTKIEKTIKKLIKRHETFRTSFYVANDEPVQRIHDEVEFEIEYDNASPFEDQPALISSFIRTFDLSKAPLLRVRLLKDGEGNQMLLVDMHHIISDGVSHEILEMDFMRFYEGEELPRLRIQYKDFSQWQNSERQQEKIKSQEEYWLKEFNGEISLLNLPTDYPRTDEMHFKGEVISFTIHRELTTKLKELAKQLNVTLTMSLLSAFTILLAKYSGQKEIIVGTVIAGRRHTDLENIIGFFVNMLAIKTAPSGNQSFSTFLLQLKEKTVNAYENQEYQFEELVSKLPIPRQPGRHPLVDTVFVFHEPRERRPIPETLNKPRENRSENQNIRSYSVSHFDLMLHVTDNVDSLLASLEFSTDLFKKSTGTEISNFYKDILKQVVENPGIKLEEIQMDLNLSTANSRIIDEEKEDWGL
jgi:tyrocidine synthetase-3